MTLAAVLLPSEPADALRLLRAAGYLGIAFACAAFASSLLIEQDMIGSAGAATFAVASATEGLRLFRPVDALRRLSYASLPAASAIFGGGLIADGANLAGIICIGFGVGGASVPAVTRFGRRARALDAEVRAVQERVGDPEEQRLQFMEIYVRYNTGRARAAWMIEVLACLVGVSGYLASVVALVWLAVRDVDPPIVAAAILVVLWFSAGSLIVLQGVPQEAVSGVALGVGFVGGGLYTLSTGKSLLGLGLLGLGASSLGLATVRLARSGAVRDAIRALKTPDTQDPQAPRAP